MAQMHAIGTLEAQPQWLEYVQVLNHVLGNYVVDVEATYSCLEESLPSIPALQGFHEMLMEECMDGVARTLPPALASVYPWTKIATAMAVAFIAFAQVRERAMSRFKDEFVARGQVASICQEILQQAPAQDASIVNEDPLAAQLQDLSIGSNGKNSI
jgi:hypothetical protein